MGYNLGEMYSNVLSALQAAPTRTLVKAFSWEDRGFFGSKTKQYVLMIKEISEQEAKQQYNYVFSLPAWVQQRLLILAFAGELPPRIREHLSPRDLQQGSTQPFSCTGGYLAQGFMVELERFGVDGEAEWDAV